MTSPRRIEGCYAGIAGLGDWFSGEPGVGVARMVAVALENNEWAAYCETPFTRQNGNSNELIISDGQKLTAWEATEIFGGWADRMPYRD